VLAQPDRLRRSQPGKVVATPPGASVDTVDSKGKITMKQYVVDQLREEDYDAILKYLKEHAEESVLGEIFWVELPPEIYSEVQGEHQECRPFCFAVNLNRKQVSFEWLIRSRQRMRCTCIAYANPRQRDHIIDFADRMLDQLKLKL